MNQQEMQAFFLWCESTLLGFEVVENEESTHYYLHDERIGGWAGDSKTFFLEHNEICSGAIRMMDAVHGKGL